MRSGKAVRQKKLLKRFIKDIEVEVISADVVDKRTQHATKATIAFTVTYQDRSPELAQQVANELTSLFLGENLKSRERQAQEATSFLQQESENLAQHINEIDEKIAKFKRRANGALPELAALNQQLMNQAERELMDVDQQIRSLEERKTYLEGELATIKPNTPILSVTGERILDSTERLRALRAEYAAASANLSADHPDIVKIRLHRIWRRRGRRWRRRMAGAFRRRHLRRGGEMGQRRCPEGPREIAAHGRIRRQGERPDRGPRGSRSVARVIAPDAQKHVSLLG